jgi:hypothetical protein
MKTTPTLCLPSSLCAAACLAALLQACAATGPKDLTRDRARKLIEADKSFAQPYRIKLESAEKYHVSARSADEDPPDARAVEEFCEDYPLTAALRLLELVEVKAIPLKRPESLGYAGRVTLWQYRMESMLTTKGEQLAEGAKDGLPLYRRGVVEVTGVTAGRQDGATAEFKWKRVPTPVGEALEAEGMTFLSLPPEIQQRLRRSISKFGNALPVSYKAVQNGRAELRLYGDGWRVERLQL